MEGISAVSYKQEDFSGFEPETTGNRKPNARLRNKSPDMEKDKVGP